jgi:hypothetical protein
MPGRLALHVTKVMLETMLADDQAGFAKIKDLGLKMAERIRQRRQGLNRHGIVVQGVNSMFQIFFTDRPEITDYRDFCTHVDRLKFRDFALRLMDKGIYMNPSATLHSLSSDRPYRSRHRRHRRRRWPRCWRRCRDHHRHPWRRASGRADAARVGRGGLPAGPVAPECRDGGAAGRQSMAARSPSAIRRWSMRPTGCSSAFRAATGVDEELARLAFRPGQPVLSAMAGNGA